MVKLSSKILGSFITHGNANSRYLGLDTMGYLALKHPGLRVFDKLKDKIFLFLRDRDESIQRRALDLLFSLCTLETAKEIVEELMGRLDTGKRGFRVELVTKIAVLTERFATEYTWYVDVMFRLIDEAGDSIDKDLVNRVIQVILANEELQLHAARLSFQYLSLSLKNTTNAKIIYVYLLGELGSIISEECPPSQQVDVVKQATKFYSPGNGGASLSSNASESEKDNFRAISATYFAKAAANFPNLYDECISGLLVCGETNSVEVQTRVGEYMALINTKDSVLISSVFEKVPPAPDSKSTLISRLTTKKKSRVGDRRTWIPGEHVFNLESAQPNSWAAILEPTIAIRSAHTTSPVTFHPNFDFSTFLLNFNTLLSTKAGVLFSNDFIDLTFKATLESCSISLLLSFTNKSNESLLEFSAAIDTTAPKALSLTTPVDLPQSACLYPNSPINLSFVLECCGFYVPAPILRFKYLATSLDSYSDFSLPLPILFLSFNEPVSLSAPDFQTRWSQLDATSYESSTVFKPRLNSKQLSTSKSSHSASNLKESTATISSPLFEPRNTTTPEETGSEFIHFAKSTISSLGFHLVSSSIDTNIDAVSIFSTSSSGKFGCLLRLNYSSNFCSFTVRSTYPDLSKNVMHTIKGLFS
ncbi:AP-2 complex subunit alpha [Zancudomyces culisetae]|uniref:AP-2 complex subunit alpha n=1 Tax=Zancudomyces culisetae TaxID=1213189 RepID=A0A1R1PFX5_ZANCU|nr:AP-2 complex subunit alpha [Zancudomyces culisetae]|eukprot:OMH79857.1 AP-2 complex subunit alpha [Zancudomyces culisetae]